MCLKELLHLWYMIQKHVDNFYSIPKLIPDPEYDYEIYIFRENSWMGIYQVDGDKHLHKKKRSKFNQNWKIFDPQDSKIADTFMSWSAVFGDHSECKEEDFNEYRKAYLSNYQNISMWKFKSKKLIEKAKEFYEDQHNDFRAHFGEFGIQEWYFDRYGYQKKDQDQDVFDYMFDKGTKSIEIIKPIYVNRWKEPLAWHTHALQNVDYWSTDICIRFKRI